MVTRKRLSFLPKVLLLFLLAAWQPSSQGSYNEDHDYPRPIFVHLHSQQASSTPPGLRAIEFCSGCQDPDQEGSILYGLSALKGVDSYQLVAPLVYFVPNDGSRPALNAPSLAGCVALLKRGNTPLVDKVLLAQEAGAVAALLVDDGTCVDELFTDCGRAGRASDGGFAKKDEDGVWRKVTIPAILITKTSGQRIDNVMMIHAVDVPGMGTQYITMSPY